MAITFNEINTTLRTPGTSIEIDNSLAGSGSFDQQNLLVVGYSSDKVGQVEEIYSYNQAIEKYGQGSMLAGMLKKVFLKNPSVSVLGYGIKEPETGTKAAASIEVSTDAVPLAGSLSISVAGNNLKIPVTKDATDAVVAEAIRDYINARAALPFTATASNGTVTLKANHKGDYANAWVIKKISGFGIKQASGVTLKFEAFKGGSGAPDLDDLIKAMGQNAYHYLANPFTDTTNLEKLKESIAAAYKADLMNYGMVFCAVKSDIAGLKNYAKNLNTPFIATADAGITDATTYEVAAGFAAAAASVYSIDPAMPLNYEVIEGLGANVDRLANEKESLLHSGITALAKTKSGDLAILRAITHYRFNPAGVADDSYLDCSTIYTAGKVREYQHNKITLRYAGYKAADKAQLVPAGQKILTVPALKAEYLSIYSDLIDMGLVEDFDSYKESLIIEADSKIAGRFNVLDNPNYITPLHIIAARTQFELVDQD